MNRRVYVRVVCRKQVWKNSGLADKASRGGGQAPHSDSEQGLAATSFQRSRTEQQPRTTAVIASGGQSLQPSKIAWGAVETRCVPPLAAPLGEASRPPTRSRCVRVANCPHTLFPRVLGLFLLVLYMYIQKLRKASSPKPPVSRVGKHEFCSVVTWEARAPCCDPRRIDKT